MFGTLRFIELFSNNEGENKKAFDNYATAFQLTKLLDEPYEIIGTVNGMEPILEINKKIVVHSSVKHSFITIAKNIAECKAILQRADAVWLGHQGQMFLPKDETTIGLYKEFAKYIQKIKNIDSHFWIDLAFKEMNIRYQV